MPGLHHDVRSAAANAGIVLDLGVSVPWLSSRGHLDEFVQANADPAIVEALGAIHASLGGDADALAAKRGGRPTPDLVDASTGQVVEVDEVQHFTTARALTFTLYPTSLELLYDVATYRQLIDQWRGKADRAFAHKVSRDFPRPGGRQAQRAYNDALRDLLAPTFTGHPIIRVALPDRNLVNALEALAVLRPSGRANDR